LKNQALIPPNEIVKISDKINNAILKGLGLEPEKRPQTMAEFLRLLDIQPQPVQIPQPQPVQIPQPQPVQIPQPNIELKSAKGVNYHKLEQLLKAGNWVESDQETARKMLEVAGRTKERNLRDSDIDNFPCEDLRTIDQLWVKYSNGRFGFSVQKRIYRSLGGSWSYEEKVWEAFGDQVGWRVGGSWLDYKDLKFNQTAPVGHLPWGVGYDHRWWARAMDRLSPLAVWLWLRLNHGTDLLPPIYGPQLFSFFYLLETCRL
jgi:serine/threonine-protein kinase